LQPALPWDPHSRKIDGIKFARKVGAQTMVVDLIRRYGGLAFGGFLTLLSVNVAAATQLITEKEAHLPRDNSKLRIGIERGPDVIPVYPAAGSGLIQSPFRFRIKFESHGSSHIDIDSVTVLYKTIPAIDLTERLRPFIEPSGIDMPGAEVPAGIHRIWIFLKDSDGRDGRNEIQFQVEQ
jgi:hypothetical protein